MSIKKAVSDLSKASIAIIGNPGLCIRYDAEANESIEKKTFSKLNSTSMLPCGCAEIAAKCRKLTTGFVDIYGIVGSDPFGILLLSILKDKNLNVDNIIIEDKKQSLLKHQTYYQNGRKNILANRDEFNRKHEVIASLRSNMKKGKQHYRCILICDGYDLDYNDLIESTPNKTRWIDGRTGKSSSMKNTIQIVSGSVIEDSRDNTADKIIFDSSGVIIETGINRTPLPPILKIHNTDSEEDYTAFCAGVLTAIGSGSSIIDAATIGNIASAVSFNDSDSPPPIKRLETIMDSPDYCYNTELADNPRAANYLKTSDGSTELEIILPSVRDKFAGRFPAAAVFDHDGTVSTLRQGWEEVMLDMMIKAVTGEHYSELSASTISEISTAAGELIEKTTGVQTIIQIHEMISLIKRIDCIPEDKIRSPMEYKEIYNRLLKESFSEKKRRFLNKDLSIEDLTIKGALDFLTLLKKNGTILYLASGTDEDDVRAEAELLGYSDLFNGGIFGSVNDINNDPKKLVIKKIIKEMKEKKGIDASTCIVFGDGPVEIREARKNNITAVGLLSDERQRFGINLSKRKRLVLAGSDLLIPDFSWQKDLLQFLGCEYRKEN